MNPRPHRIECCFAQSKVFTCSLVIGLWFSSSLGRAQDDRTYHLSSPDNAIRVSIQMPADKSNDRPRWSASFRGKPLFTNCALGLQVSQVELMSGIRLVR